jgi:hypothetical protein
LGVPRLVLARARSRGAVAEGRAGRREEEHQRLRGIKKVCRGNERKGAGQTRFKRTGPTVGSRVEEIERREVEREAKAGDA